MRLVFAGTPAVAVPALDELAKGPHEIVAVITRDDAALGRRRVLTPSPVASAAMDRHLATIKANRLDASVTERIADLRPDLGVIVAYGGLVREPLLSVPRYGWINLHFSLLPRWRGAAPVQRALIAGDRVTGASVFQLVPELDAGDVFAEATRAIGPEETAGQVLDALAGIGAHLLARTVDAIGDGTALASPQTGEPTLAPKLTIDDAHIDLAGDGARAMDRIRGVTPEPGAFVMLAGQRFKILEARPALHESALQAGRAALRDKRVLVGTATHPLELVTVQPAGKRPMPAPDWWRGLADAEVVFS
ncbi:methionyl-tRNA formyltransferase [Diaminobutyricibacter tongyongensis]|uniref:Methionyl-tRNA formyltransferase n=1 Tax=Leifsonia tongyongensis TaxID=1268043 RepID=A0A6L9XYC5_9MICO|nr:methionyl-tRNA formyltransferase [Diaminobutyricibacter tongyongensis]NEN06286.1 methionyl-tRNA formyltransferase [Diaminobutyricibacter tongyongensis]